MKANVKSAALLAQEMDGAMRAIETAAAAGIFGEPRHQRGRRPVSMLKLPAREVQQCTPEELESAILGDDLSWEYLGDEEPEAPMNVGGLSDWLPEVSR